MESPALIRLSGVNKSFPVAGGAPLQILRGLTWELAAGATAAIMGPSGSGKSTILNLLGTLDKPDQGDVWLDGENLSLLDERQLARVRNRKIGFIFQAHHLLPHCTVMENVLVPVLAEQSSVPAATMDRAKFLLDRVGMGGRLSHRPGQLSGGERQRAAVVRALIQSPCLLLADEPTGALDRASAGELSRLLRDLNTELKITLVVVTHSLSFAREMGRVFELRDGRLQETSPVAG